MLSTLSPTLCEWTMEWKTTKQEMVKKEKQQTKKTSSQLLKFKKRILHVRNRNTQKSSPFFNSIHWTCHYDLAAWLLKVSWETKHKQLKGSSTSSFFRLLQTDHNYLGSWQNNRFSDKTESQIFYFDGCQLVMAVEVFYLGWEGGETAVAREMTPMI